MNEQDYFRTRVNTKQKSSGEWYVDFTSEEKAVDHSSPSETAARHMLYLNAVENAMIAAGKKLVGRE